jgi:hypothetical protein
MEGERWQGVAEIRYPRSRSGRSVKLALVLLVRFLLLKIFCQILTVLVE